MVQDKFHFEVASANDRGRVRNAYAQFKAEIGAGGVKFPDTSTLAEFKPHSQTIHLHEVEHERLKEGVRSGNISQVRGSIQTIVHEITHWADMVSTLWGREYLVRIYNAFSAMVGSEPDYWKMVELHDEDRRLNFPRYYRKIEEAATGSPKQPWSIEYSSGIEFDAYGRQDVSRPIFFVKFGDRATGALVARQPLSVGALLETCATWSELRSGIALTSAMAPDEKAVERALWQKQVLENLYHPQLTEYSAPAHMLAVLAESKEVMLTYQAAAMVSLISLNLSSELFQLIRPPKGFKKFGEDRLNAFLHRKDRGYAYAAICHSAQRLPDNPDSLSQWLDDALATCGLPDRSNILDAAKSHLVGAVDQILDSEFSESGKYILEVGEKVFELRSSEASGALQLEVLFGEAFPGVWMFDRDADLFSISKNPMDTDRFNPVLMYGAEASLNKHTRNFLGACR